MFAHCVVAPAVPFALLMWVASASAQVIVPDVWGTDGNVTSLARVDNTLYLAGNFGLIGPSSGGGVPLDRRSGAPLRPFPRVAGVVRANVPDGRAPTSRTCSPTVPWRRGNRASRMRSTR